MPYMSLWHVRHVPLVCSACSFDMFSMFLQYVQHAHNTCSSCKNYMYLHVLPHVPCSMCMFFSGGPSFTTFKMSTFLTTSQFTDNTTLFIHTLTRSIWWHLSPDKIPLFSMLLEKPLRWTGRRASRTIYGLKELVSAYTPGLEEDECSRPEFE